MILGGIEEMYFRNGYLHYTYQRNLIPIIEASFYLDTFFNGTSRRNNPIRESVLEVYENLAAYKNTQRHLAT
jgi:hypothetical protein